MKVNLIKEATYELHEEKLSKLSFKAFCTMANTSSIAPSQEVIEKRPDVMALSNIDEFKKIVSEGGLDNFDQTKDVYFMPDGKILMYLAPSGTVNNVTNGTTNTQENKTE